jgi:hypothetical protein
MSSEDDSGKYTEKYTEEREFVLRFELRCPFPEDYQGEQDGYAWAEDFQPIAAEIVHAAAATLHKHPGWRVRAGNRGRPTDEEITLIVERVVVDAAGSDK